MKHLLNLFYVIKTEFNTLKDNVIVKFMKCASYIQSQTGWSCMNCTVLVGSLASLVSSPVNMM